MNYELLEALNQIAREKNVDREVLIETLMAGMLQAARRRYGPSSNIEMNFDRDRGLIEGKRIRTVVGHVSDEAQEIQLEDAREIDAALGIGDQLVEELDVTELGRSAASATKHVLVQRVREAERDRVYAEFHGREGELITGIVQQVDRRNVLVQVESIEAILPEREALHRDRFRQGDHITALLMEVDRLSKGPQVVLSRSHPDFLRRLFENEVPEISERIVEIRSIAREAGSRSKVGVYSHDDRVDAVGACVGVKGSRVQNIVRELGGERIDIVPWSSDPALFVTRALSPAKVQRVDIDEEQGAVTVVVAEDQLSLAIGKGGQNVRLAMRLTGWNIELVSDQQVVEERDDEDVADFDIEDLTEEIGPRVTEWLIQAGLETARDVLRADTDGLQAIEGIGPKTAQKVLDAVGELYESRLAAVRAERGAEVDGAEADDDGEPGTPELASGESETAPSITHDEPVDAADGDAGGSTDDDTTTASEADPVAIPEVTGDESTEESTIAGAEVSEAPERGAS